MRSTHFLRCWQAKTVMIFHMHFFMPRTLFWNLVFPLFWGLQFYFQYLPFGAGQIAESLFSISIQIPLVGYTLTGQFVYMVFINAALFGGLYFLYEREQQTLETLLMSPAPRTAIMLGSATAGLLNFFWFFTVFNLVMILLRVPIVIHDVLACLTAFGLTVFAMVSTGFLFQGLFIGSRIGDSLATAVQEPMMFLSGLTFPIKYLPRALLVLALSLPLSYGLLIFRGTVLAGLMLKDILEPLICLSSLSVAVMLLSVKMNRLIEAKIKKDATTILF